MLEISVRDDYSNLRKEYEKGELTERTAGNDPLELFSEWIKDAKNASRSEPNAMTLATVDELGRPHARIVLLKEHNDREFVFFSNYKSNKGLELSRNRSAALVFWWDQLERQVRIEGSVARIDDARSDEYFFSRPRNSQIGAWASPQSEIINSYQELDTKFSEIEKMYPDFVPRPPFWGGFGLMAERIEFWQGRASRLHDRLNYRFTDNQWLRERRAP